MFKIIFNKQSNPSADFDKEETSPLDVTALESALVQFGHMYWNNTWEIVLGDSHFKWFIDDLWFMWDELPEKLHRLNVPTTEAVVIDSVAQGSEKQIQVQPLSNGKIEVTISTGPSDSEKSPGEIIEADDFINEWKSLIDSVVGQLVKNGLLSEDDDSIRDYKARLP